MLKQLDLKQKEFTANGNKYFIMDKISIDRYAVYQELLPELTFGTSFGEMFRQLKNAYNHLNASKFADSAVIIHNLMSSVASVEQSQRVHPALKMAALFINLEDEDTGVYDEPKILNKIEDWRKEGYDISCFFSLALNSIEGFREAYNEFIKKNDLMQS